jgi:dTDP-4-dehydrorhamnose reductase
LKLLVLGASGQVARGLLGVEHPDVNVVAIGRPDLDLERPDTLAAAVDRTEPDVVASVGAYTAVDQAESEPEIAWRVNALGPEAAARACADRRLPLVHVSTDYVFDGRQNAPYRETDPTGPTNVYGRSKLEGEQRVAAAAPRHAILRTAWVYAPEGKNFVRTMLRLARTRDEVGVVADQLGCPTYAPDLADAIVVIAHRLVSDRSPALHGVFHAAGAGETSWHGFASAVFDASRAYGQPGPRVKALTTDQYPTPAGRPANSRLNCDRLEQVYGVRLRPWPQALAACIARIAERNDWPQ